MFPHGTLPAIYYHCMCVCTMFAKWFAGHEKKKKKNKINFEHERATEENKIQHKNIHRDNEQRDKKRRKKKNKFCELASIPFHDIFQSTKV